MHTKYEFPTYLYDSNRFNDLRFFLSLDMWKYDAMKKKRRRQIAQSPDPALEEKREFDWATAWYWGRVLECRFDRPSFVAKKILVNVPIYLDYTKPVLKRLVPISREILLSPLKNKIGSYSNHAQNSYQDVGQSYANYAQHRDKNIIPIVAGYPDVQFNIVLSAIPTLYSQRRKVNNPQWYIFFLSILRDFVLEMEKYPNVNVFAYGLERFTDDLRLYKDKTHFHPEVNNYIIEKMARGEGKLTKDNIDEYLVAFDQKISRYRLPEKWRPRGRVKNRGYLSMDAARRLIESDRDDYYLQDVSSLSMSDQDLPECAAKIFERAR
jgi:hypothetical protein